MKKTFLVAIVACFSLAQAQAKNNTPNNAGAQGSPTASSAGTATSDRQSMMEEHREMLEQMRSELDAMGRKVEMMSAESVNIHDVQTRNAFETNVQLWQNLIADLRLHVERMEKTMQGSGGGHPQPAGPKPRQ